MDCSFCALRHGSHVEVLGPKDLRKKVADLHRAALNIYENK